MPSAFRCLGPADVRARTHVPADTLDHGYASIGRQRIVFIGASGAGKTTLACAMLQRLIDDGVGGSYDAFVRARQALFVETSSLCRAVRDHPLGAGDAPLLARALHASVLVLDDLGQELEMRMACNPVVEVIRERHANERATWVTTFLPMERAEKAYGSGTARRVFDGATVIELGVV